MVTPTKSTRLKLDAWLPLTKANGLTSYLEIESSVSHSTSVPLAAAVDHHAHIPIPVPYVVTSPMDVPNVLLDKLYPIITKLKVNAWEHALSDAGICEKYADILVGLRQGFPCSLENLSLSCTFIPPNHYTFKEDEDFIIMKYAEEIELGRISHGYNPDTLFSLIGHFHTAPLAVIEQAPGKRCVIYTQRIPTMLILKPYHARQTENIL